MSEPSRGTTVYLAVFAAMVTSALTTYGLRALENAPGGEEAPTTVEVPAVLGLEQATAAELARNRGLRLVVRAEEPSAEHPAGRVSAQEPLAGSSVPSDTAVTVVISTGAPKVTIPELVGQPVDQVTARLQALGLTVGEVARTGQGEPNAVTALAPPPGAEVEVGATVAITAAPGDVEIPDVVGMPQREAREAIEAAGLVIGRTRRRFDENRPDFSILRVEPEAGTRVPPGSEVEITVND